MGCWLRCLFRYEHFEKRNKLDRRIRIFYTTGNQRGNTNSRRHQYLSPNKKEFWDFSFHEIGQYDLPAMINYALAKTNQSALHYIGHSQGTTAFFAMASLRKEMNEKIKTMHALAPVAFMSNLVSPMVI
jgi:pimeloyl-ACP methyl ester carboxylesterase